ncbi:hypothetical protein [Endozoicomonas sp.]|uniref:hypothetical protein n=1 Tax=Endozoicomonas sp. TaxID=1892382 RepID=UPI00383B5422
MIAAMVKIVLLLFTSWRVCNRTVAEPSIEVLANGFEKVAKPLAQATEYGCTNGINNVARMVHQVTRQPGLTGVKLINTGTLLMLGGRFMWEPAPCSMPIIFLR